MRLNVVSIGARSSREDDVVLDPAMMSAYVFALTYVSKGDLDTT